jgi:hypothetical protein
VLLVGGIDLSQTRRRRWYRVVTAEESNSASEQFISKK